MHKLKILFYAICGELLKLYYKVGLGTIPYGLNREEERKEKVTVSLTSYGRRVAAVLPLLSSPYFAKPINQTELSFG